MDHHVSFSSYELCLLELTSFSHHCDDGTLPPDSDLAKWGPMFLKVAAKSGKKLDTIDTFKSKIEAAGFTNIHEKVYKLPFGEWTKNPVLREAGKFNRLQLREGMEGYAMYAAPCYSRYFCTLLTVTRYLLTKFGDPEPWSPEEVQVLLAKVRKDMDNKDYHAYSRIRRVWAQKPLDTAP